MTVDSELQTQDRLFATVFGTVVWFAAATILLMQFSDVVRGGLSIQLVGLLWLSYFLIPWAGQLIGSVAPCWQGATGTCTSLEWWALGCSVG